MQFDQFHPLLINALRQPMPGEAAQDLMAPVGRPSTESLLLKYPNHRKSAVLMLLYPDQNGLAHTVFMERAHDGSLHGGQISFPGGGIEQGDLLPEHAALREFEEELGLEMQHIRIAGALTPLFIPASKFMVYPFIGMCETPPSFRPDPIEVHSIVETSVQDVMQLKEGVGDFKTSYGTLTAPCYHLKSHLLWGATAMIVSEFRVLIHVQLQ